MLYGEKSRQDLNKHAEKLFSVLEKRDKQKLYDDLYEKFTMSPSVADAMVSFKRDINEFNPFSVFCVVYFLDRDSLGKFFTQEEITYFSNSKFEETKIKFPVKIDNIVQVTEDQWIGKISSKKYLKLRDDGLINYQENQQRALRVVKYGEVEIYKPFVNQKAVKEIKEAMENGNYIPDPITLNMPEGCEYNFSDGCITIYSSPTGMVNLLDGYHRTLALSSIADFNPDFDMPIELRITSFSQSKAEQFIYQADQKTQMKKIVSDSFNPNDLANMVCQRLNDDKQCNIAGMIGRNKANISMPELAKLISYFYVSRDIKKDDRMKFVINTKNELKEKFNALTEEYPEFLGKYTTEMLFVTIYVFANNINLSNIKTLLDRLSDEDRRTLQLSNGIRRKAINILKKAVENNV
jgi:hypothetical protein